MIIYQTISILLVLLNVETSFQSNRPTPDPLWYLSKFGYLDLSAKKTGSMRMLPNLKNPSLPKDVNIAIQKFQRYTGLNPTGKLDNDTMKMMRLPRCGQPDKLSNGNRHKKRNKRFNNLCPIFVGF